MVKNGPKNNMNIKSLTNRSTIVRSAPHKVRATKIDFVEEQPVHEGMRLITPRGGIANHHNGDQTLPVNTGSATCIRLITRLRHVISLLLISVLFGRSNFCSVVAAQATSVSAEKFDKSFSEGKIVFYGLICLFLQSYLMYTGFISRATLLKMPSSWSRVDKIMNVIIWGFTHLFFLVVLWFCLGAYTNIFFGMLSFKWLAWTLFRCWRGCDNLQLLREKDMYSLFWFLTSVIDICIVFVPGRLNQSVFVFTLNYLVIACLFLICSFMFVTSDGESHHRFVLSLSPYTYFFLVYAFYDPFVGTFFAMITLVQTMLLPHFDRLLWYVQEPSIRLYTTPFGEVTDCVDWAAREGERYARLMNVHGDDVIAPPLVGIEPNPGPPCSSTPRNEKKKSTLSIQEYDTPEFRDLHRLNKSKFKKIIRKMKVLGDLAAASPEQFKAQVTVKMEHRVDPQQFAMVEQIASMVTSISAKVHGATDGESKVKTTVIDVTSSVIKEVAIGLAKDTGSYLSELANSVIEQLIRIIKSSKGKAGALLISLSVMYWMKRNGSSVTALLAAGTVLAVALAASGMDEVVQTMKGFMANLSMDIFQAQDGESDPEYWITTGITACLATFYFPRNKTLDMRGVVKSMTDIEKGSRGIDFCVKFILKIAQRIADFAARTLGFRTLTLFNTAIKDVDEWMECVRKFFSEHGRGETNIDMMTYDRVCNLLEKGYDLSALVMATKASGTVNSVIRPLMSGLDRIREELETKGLFQAKTRIMPVGLMLEGESQIGKTRFLRYFALAFLAAVGTPEQYKAALESPDAYIYFRCPEIKFWDGYFNQFICLFDEFNLTNKKLMTPENAPTEFVRAKNTAPYNLHMASLGDKGKTYFRSALIVCTSNESNVAEGCKDAVSHPEAVVNRFDFELVVCVKKEYATAETRESPAKYRRLDMSKLPQDGGYDENVHEFHVLKRRPKPNCPGQFEYVNTEIIDFLELLKRTVATHRRYKSDLVGTAADDRKAIKRGEQFRAEVYRSDEELSQRASEFPMGLFDGFESSEGSEATDDDVESLMRAMEITGEDLCSVKSDKNTLKRLMSKFKHWSTWQLLSTKHAILASCASLTETFEEKFPLTKRSAFACVELVTHMLKTVGKKIWSLLGSISKDNIIDLVFGSALIGVAIYLARIVLSAFGMFESSPSSLENEFKAQLVDNDFDSVTSKIWKKNVYTISAGNTRSGSGFFINRTLFCFPSHFLACWKKRYDPSVIIRLTENNGSFREIPLSDMLEAEIIEGDLALLDIPSARLHADLRPFILYNDEFGDRKSIEASVIVTRAGRDVLTKTKGVVEAERSYTDDFENQYTLARSVIYNVQTFPGDCGVPVFISDPSTRAKKMIGFHVAGCNGHGMASMFSKRHKTLFDHYGDFKAQLSDGTSIELVGQVPRGPGVSGQSKIRKSPLYGAYGSALKAPAKLKPFLNSDGVRVEPMTNALQRYDKDLLKYDVDLVDVCAHAAIKDYFNGMNIVNMPLKRVTNDVAMFGNNEKFCDPVKRKTSPGYPYNIEPLPGFEGKTRFFGKGLVPDKSGPDFKRLEMEVQECEVKMLAGERIKFYYADALKDELQKISKVEKGDTRLFCPSPIVYTILFRKYFLSFIVNVMQHHNSLESQVGINPYSEDWEVLKRRLTAFGPAVFAGDFTSFDALQSAQILEKIGDKVICLFEDTEFNGIRKLLWRECYDTLHIMGKNVYHWRQSLPSGHPATSIINCLFNSTIFRMAYVEAHGKDLSCLKHFKLFIVLIVYGDDNALGVSKGKRQLFNQNTCTEYFRRLGLFYTPETKGEDVADFRDISEIEFLKRSFRYEPRVGRHVAPLRLSSILEMPYWSKKDQFREIACQNVENAIRELSLHDEQVFNTWVPIITRASKDLLDYIPENSNRNALIDEICSMEIHFGVD